MRLNKSIHIKNVKIVEVLFQLSTLQKLIHIKNALLKIFDILAIIDYYLWQSTIAQIFKKKINNNNFLFHKSIKITIIQWRSQEFILREAISYHIISYHIILYIIKVELRRRGCAKWRHQIAEIFLNFFILRKKNI